MHVDDQVRVTSDAGSTPAASTTLETMASGMVNSVLEAISMKSLQAILVEEGLVKRAQAASYRGYRKDFTKAALAAELQKQSGRYEDSATEALFSALGREENPLELIPAFLSELRAHEKPLMVSIRKMKVDNMEQATHIGGLVETLRGLDNLRDLALKMVGDDKRGSAPWSL
jgi:hypothetical protein